MKGADIRGRESSYSIRMGIASPMRIRLALHSQLRHPKRFFINLSDGLVMRVKIENNFVIAQSKSKQSTNYKLECDRLKHR